MTDSTPAEHPDARAEAEAAAAHWDDVYDLTKTEIVGQRLRNALGALLAERPAPTPDAEPVAWEVTWNARGAGVHDRWVTLDKSKADAWDDDRRTVTPLYRHAAPPTDTRLEQAALAVRALVRTPRPQQSGDGTRTVTECDIIVNAALGQAEAAVRAIAAERPAPTPNDRADRLAAILREAIDYIGDENQWDGTGRADQLDSTRAALAQAEAEGLL